MLLLLEHGASVSTINGEGLRPANLPRDSQVGQESFVFICIMNYFEIRVKSP